jgi:hypothetical protein
MMRSPNPNVQLQNIMRVLYGNNKVICPQFSGTYQGTVTDNHTTSPSTCPVGQIKFRVPSIGNDIIFGPCQHPGPTEPPCGTNCAVAFQGPFTNVPIVLSVMGV